MPAQHKLTVTVSDETFEFINSKLASGHYTEPSDVIQDSLEQMRLRGEKSDDWFRAEVLPALDEYDANPASGRNFEEVMNHLATKRERA